MSKKAPVIATKNTSTTGRIGEAIESQIAAWKNMYGEVFEIAIEGHVGYVRGFDRATMKFALSQLKINVNTETRSAEMDFQKIIEIGEIGLKNCWLGGSEEILKNDRLYISAAMQVGELFDIAEVNLKKL